MKVALHSNVTGITYLQYSSTIITFILLFLGFSWEWWVLSIFVYYLTGCLGITITFHRYLTHRSFKMPKILEYLFSFFGAMGGTGSSIGWAAVHNAHHKYSDTEKDPHSPHILGLKMMLSRYNYDFNFWDARFLLRDKFHVFLHNYYYLIMLIWASTLLVIDYRLFLFGFVVPQFLQIWASNISNYANHIWGYSNYDTGEGSKNTWWVSAITWGEGWHNNHHSEPWKYTFQHRWWEIDVSAYTIYLICILTGNKASLSNSKY
jgi:fatty-acid desaturase